MQFKLDNNAYISLEIVRKQNMKHIYLRVTPNGVIVSTNKRTKLADIEAFVYSKSTWLIKHLKVQEQRKEKQLLVTGNFVYFQGQAFVLKCIEKENMKKPTLEFTENKFIINMPKETPQEALQLLFDNFYKQQAIEQIYTMVEEWSNKMNMHPKNIGFRKAKRRWGSCSSQNTLSFNYYLMKLPLEIVEYVVVHELAHIKEKNHSKNFWAVVEEFLPNYKELVQELREFESVL
jgi:predicted metal-dependent hydrolase